MHLLRMLSFVIGLAALLVAHPGYALGLGESELKSALNQPFQADIRLTNLGGLSRDEIIVRLATPEDFERAGLERMAFYGRLDFELLLDHPEGPIVRVTTQQPVREPYLNFLVEARWASGRLLREYTFLLDLPTFDDDRRAQPVESATSGRSQAAPTRQQPRPQARQTQAGTEPEPEARQRAGYDGDTYSVTSSDTLWEIALRVRPGRDLSVQQTMLAIQRKNPEAFINGNINLLREGQVLRLPNRDEIRNLNPQNAVREVAQHNREWSDGAMGAQLDAGQRASRERSGPSDVSGQVRLAAPNQSGAGEAGQGGGASTDSGAELQADLSAAQEELEKSQRENRELSSRVEELEAQIDTMESLIEASNEQLRALQASAQQSREAAQTEREAGTTDTSTEAPAEPEAQVAEQPEAEVNQTDESAAAAAEQEDRSRRVVRSLPQEKTLVDHLMDNLLWIGLGVLVVLLGVFVALRRRQQSDEPAEQAHDEDFEPAFDEEGFSEDFEPGDESEEGAGIDLAHEETEYNETEAWDDEPEAGVEAETGDVVGEADIYIAYGKLDQAEELLLNGLEKEPNSPAILSKLLEVYAENRDVESFDRHYSTLLGTDDRPAIQRAGELRDTIPGAGEFDISALGSGAAAPMNEEPATAGEEDFSSLEEAGSDDFDFKFDLDDVDDKPATEKDSDDGELTLEDDFSFDLDDDDTTAPATTESELDVSSNRYDLSFEETETEKDDDFSLDFDLDDDSEVVTLESDSSPEAASSNDDQEDLPELDLKLDEEKPAEGGAQAETVSDEDDWNFELDETPEAGNFEALDEALSDLDEEPSSPTSEAPGEAGRESQSVGVEKADVDSDEDDFSFDLEDDADDELTVHESGLDRDATSEDDQEAGQDAFADLDDTLEEDWSDAQSDREPGAETSVTAARESDADETDLDLDDVDMGDMDLSSLDEEMSDLDADLDGDSAPALEDELSVETESGAQPAEPESSSEAVAEDVDEDQMFEEALSGLSKEESADTASSESPEASDEDMDAELDFLADTDEAATKLDLARAYIDMGDADGARDILEEVRQEGNEEQQKDAEELLGRIES